MTLSELRRRVKWWQRQLSPLGLSHWQIDCTLVDTPGENPGADAVVLCADHYDSATIEFRTEWATEAEFDEIDKVIVHELLHMIFRDYEEIADKAVQHLGPVAQELVAFQLNHELEGIVERLARTIVA